MRKVNIGTSKYTEVFAIDELEFNANHKYHVNSKEKETIGSEFHYPNFADIRFQKGPIKENKVNGCHHEDLIAIVIDRLQSFQQTGYKCRENAVAITKLEEAMMWLDKRTQDRLNRGVEGTHNK